MRTIFVRWLLRLHVVKIDAGNIIKKRGKIYVSKRYKQCQKPLKIVCFREAEVFFQLSDFSFSRVASLEKMRGELTGRKWKRLS